MSQNMDLVLRLKADGSGFVGEMRQSGQAVKQLGDSGQRTSGQLDSTEKSIRNVSRSLPPFINGFNLSAAAVVGSLGMVYRQQASVIDQSAKFADRIGVTTEALSELQYMAELNGIDNLETALQRMTRSVAEAAMGTGEAVDVLDELGLSVQALQGLSPDQQLALIADAMQDVSEQSDRVRIAFRLFGAQGVSMVNMLRLGSEGMGELAQEARNLGYSLDRQAAAAIEDANDNLARLSAIATGLQRELAVGLAGAINTVADNAELLADIFGVALAMGLARATTAAGQYAISQIRQIAASRAATAAALAQAQQEERVALAKKAGALTTHQAAAATAQLTAARATQEALTKKATVTQLAYNKAIALSGGPAGLVMMAAGALAYWIMNAGGADKANKDLAGSTDLLNRKFSELSRNQLAEVRLDTQTMIRDIEQQLQKAQDTIDNTDTTVTIHPYIAGFEPFEVVDQRAVDNVVRLNSQIDTLNEQLDEQKQKLEDINTLMAGGEVPDRDDHSGKGSEEANQAAERLLANLQKQTELYDQTSQQAQVLYEIEQGGLQGVNETLKTQLIDEAKRLDLLNAQTEAAKINAEAEQQLAEMRRQAVLGNDATEVQKLQYEIDTGGLQGVDAGLQQELLEAAAELDRQRAQQQADAFTRETLQIQEQNERRLALEAAGSEAMRMQAQFDHEDRLEELARQFEEVYEAAEGNQELQLELEGNYFAAREALWSDHQLRLTEIEKEQTRQRQLLLQQQLDGYENLFGSMAEIAEVYAGEQSGIYKGLFAVSKAFAIANSIIKIQQGIAEAAALPFPANIPAMATVAAATAGIVSTIQSTSLEIQGQAHDGIGRVPSQNEGTWMLRRDEMVMNPQQTDNFNWMVAMMAQIKQAMTGAAVGSGGLSTAMPMLLKFEGLPEGYSTQQTMTDGQIVALIQASGEQTEKRTYNRIASDLRWRSGLVGKLGSPK